VTNKQRRNREKKGYFGQRRRKKGRKEQAFAPIKGGERFFIPREQRETTRTKPHFGVLSFESHQRYTHGRDGLFACTCWPFFLCFLFYYAFFYAPVAGEFAFTTASFVQHCAPASQPPPTSESGGEFVPHVRPPKKKQMPSFPPRLHLRFAGLNSTPSDEQQTWRGWHDVSEVIGLRQS